MPGFPALHRLAAVVASVALLAGTAACTDSVEPTGGLALVVGARSNTPPPALPGAAADAREAALVAQSQLSIVVADGKPFVLDGAGVLAARDENSVVQEQDRDRNRQLIDEMLARAGAKTAETDLLTALDLAARALDPATGTRTLVVVDSGLSTAGALDFDADPALLDADPTTLAAGLEDAGALPDLRGIDVVLAGLGDVVAPQQPLPLPQRINLIAIWTAIAEAAGAAEVLVDPTPLSGRPGGTLPAVTPVDPGAGPVCGTVTLGEDDIAFVADSAEFLDRAAGLAALQPLADRVRAGSFTAALTGTTADVGDKAGQVELSRQRAQAVADVLAELGVPAGRMTVTGLGSDFPGYDPDDLAANRAVTVTLAGGGVACG
ncbi:OmpA family protein [Blastococcus capsensis]|uniref:OmpA family protein n=1 Tax=Blastococcus capsensis TaxID=1564163 RepID=UPI00253FC01D|nr:OmpA family protein [Blastococcus capsensis]MDK3256567.1 OmpA family protein [Blastococcus capsensis]